MAFHIRNCVGIRDDRAFAVQWLACALPCRRFTPALADDGARLRAGVDRYSFTVRDLHPLLLAGLPAHSENLHNSVDSVPTLIGPQYLRFRPNFPASHSSCCAVARSTYASRLCRDRAEELRSIHDLHLRKPGSG